MSLTARIPLRPVGLPYTVVLSGGREVTYLWHQLTDSCTVWLVEGEVTQQDIEAGEQALRELMAETADTSRPGLLSRRR